MPVLFEAVNPDQLDYIVTEHFNPGDIIDLELQLDKNLSQNELAIFAQELARQGITVRQCRMASPYILRTQFVRPARPAGYALIPILLLIVGALSAVGVGSYIMVQIGSAVSTAIPDILKIMAAGAVAIGFVWVLTRNTSRAKAKAK